MYLRQQGLAAGGTAALLALLLPTASPATDFYVATNGSDAAAGTLAAPFRTLERARSAVRAINQAMGADVTIYLRGGTHTRTNTFELVESATAHDSGFNGHTVIWKAFPGEKPVISGGRIITGWVLHDAGRNIWRAPAGAGLQTRQLFVNGERAIRARGASTPSGFSETSTGYTLSGANTNMQAWGNKGDIEVVGFKEWKCFRCPVSNIVGTAMTMQQPAWGACQYSSWNLGAPGWIENAYELLDAEREWYLDRGAGSLYYKPGTGEDLATARVVAPAVELLVTGVGQTNSDLHNLAFEGLTFADTTWLEPSSDFGYACAQAGSYRLSASENTAEMPGAVALAFVRSVRLERNTFTRLGGAGLSVAGCPRTGLPRPSGATNITIVGNVFMDVAGTGIAVGHGFDTLIGLPHRQTRNIRIANNYVTAIGREFLDCVGIFVGYANGARVLNNEVHEVPYTGISVGWGWGNGDPTYAGANEIASNHVYRIMLSMRDGGGIYTLSGQPGSTFHHNYIHDGSGTGAAIYHDEATRYYTTTRNVLANVPQWLSIWTASIQSNTVAFNYANTSALRNDGLYNNVVSNQTGLASWPAEAQAIIAAAGLDASYRDIKPGISTNVPAPTNAPIPVAGLVLWLDADDLNGDDTPPADGSTVGLWADKSGQNHHATQSTPAFKPSVEAGELNGRPVVRGSGDDWLTVGSLRSGVGNMHAFAVSQRSATQLGGDTHQRLLSSSDGGDTYDWQAPDWTLTSVYNDADGSSLAYGPNIRILTTSSGNLKLASLDVGRDAALGASRFKGDLAEILVYDRQLAGAEVATVTNYLAAKWLVSGVLTTTTTTTTTLTSSTTTVGTSSSSTTTTAPPPPPMYTNGFVWLHAADYDEAAPNPNTDSRGNGVWLLSYATGGQSVLAGESASNWWKQAGTAMPWDPDWFGNGFGTWSRANNTLPTIRGGLMELGGAGSATYAPFRRWVNPAGKAIVVRLDAYLAKGGSGATAQAYDCVLALHDVSADTWSYLLRTNLAGTVTAIAGISNVVRTLDADDELVIGARPTSDVPNGQWYTFYDDLRIILLAADAAADTDRDGMADGNEWLAGTDPANPTSRLAWATLASTNDDHVAIAWHSATGRSYRLLACSSLVAADWTTNRSGIAATPPLNVATVHTAHAALFWRVELEH